MKTIEYDPANFTKAIGEITAALSAGVDIEVKPVDPYKKFKDAQAAGKVVQYRNNDDEWVDIPMTDKYVMYTCSSDRYRIKPNTIKMWQWVYKQAENPVLTAGFYKNEESAKKALGNPNLIQRADWTEIEVEM